ncbi:MAG: ATP synthase F0 subunit B [Proteobacteria bacterium]|nr:ATP synthase F0 subunit B [Pseudomonadota bacterium]
MLDFDITILYQMVGFFVLLFILNRLLYKPVQKVLAEREERIDGSLAQAEGLNKEVEDGLVDYDVKLKEAAVKGHEERAKLRAEGAARQKEIMEAAGVSVSHDLTVMRNELGSAKKEALTSLKDEVKSLSAIVAEKLLDRKVVTALIAFLLPLLPAIASASSEGGGDSGMLWKIINFTVLAIVVIVLWKKVIANLLRNRSAEIATAIEEAQKAKAEAESRAAEYKQKIATLDGRIAEIAAELRAEGESEKARGIVEAEKAAERLKASVELTAAVELKKARLTIKKEVAELAMEMAATILATEVKPDDQKRLVRSYIDNLKLN